jgi:hypothetical protein
MLSIRMQQGARAAASEKIFVTARSASPSYLHDSYKGISCVTILVGSTNCLYC